jgi:hypothetical protein
LTEYITVTIEGEKQKIPVPDGFRLRKQNPKCNQKGCMCAKLDNHLVCCKWQLGMEKDGSFSLFDIDPCRHGDGRVLDL